MSQQSGLFTDFYSLTMMQGYFLKKQNGIATFDMFIRNTNLGYMIFTGLETLISKILSLRFSEEDILYLQSQNIFHKDFLAYLKTYEFKGSIWAMKEGSVCFSHEPLLKIRTSIMEAQLLEGLVLNTINFQTLIATKASRICHLTKEKKVVELGLRRAQGPNGALYASRAAYIGGVTASSNTEAGKIFGIPIVGTMAHSWVMSYQDEKQAFMDFADIYPNNIAFILDTHDTLQSGIKNAIIVGKTLQKKGLRCSVRLDSGDIEYLSKRVRMLLDNAGLHDTKIIASNDLDENIIAQILSHNAPIDIFGIGTNLVTGGNISALPGVYKIAELLDTATNIFRPLIKTSNDIEKSSLPSFKQVYRFAEKPNNVFIADLIALETDTITQQKSIIFHHLYEPHKKIERNNDHLSITPLLHCYVENGVLIKKLPSIHEIQSFAKQSLAQLDNTYLRHLNPHEYQVSISRNLKNMRDDLLFKK